MGKQILAQVVDFRDLTPENKKEVMFYYKERLSSYSDLYTDIGEILLALKTDSNFYICVLLINKKPVGHIQFKYFIETKSIFIDYICMSKENYSNNHTDLLITLLSSTIEKKLEINHILTEAVFHNKNKNNALFKLFQRRGFKSLNFTYIQPPTETLFPIIGNLLVKSYSRELNIDTIVKDIYFKHYASWYKRKFYYIYLIKCLYAIQKLCIKRQQ